MAALLEQDPARAAEACEQSGSTPPGRAWTSPGVFPVAPDLVEALVELDEHDEAMAVTARLRTLSEQQQHPWGLATARRCDAVVRLATGAYDERAARALADAAAEYRRLGLRFDRARSLLSLGRAQRRMKKWGSARESLQRRGRRVRRSSAPPAGRGAHARSSGGSGRAARRPSGS